MLSHVVVFEPALSFLNRVKDEYGLCMYRDFLCIMKNCSSQNMYEIAHFVSVLFRDSRDLVLKFRMFLCASHDIDKPSSNFRKYSSLSGASASARLSEEPLSMSESTSEPPSPVSSSHYSFSYNASSVESNARNQMNPSLEISLLHSFIHKLGNRFQDQPYKYIRYLKILAAFIREQNAPQEYGRQISFIKCYAQVVELFGDWEWVLSDFMKHLPDPTRLRLTASTEQDYVINSSPLQTSAVKRIRPTTREEKLQLIDREATPLLYRLVAQNRPIVFRPALAYISKVRYRFREQRETYNLFLETVFKYLEVQRMLKKKQPFTWVVSGILTVEEFHSQIFEIFEANQDLLDDFYLYLPDDVFRDTISELYSKIAV